MFNSKAVKAHLYLEGMEVDFSSLTIQEQIGQPPTATVSLVPIMHIYNILPKTQCIITVEVEVRNPETGDTVEDAAGNKVFEEVVQFWGELRGYSLNRTAASAEVNLTFNGFTDNWTTSPIVPVDSTVPTLLESQVLGINYYEATTKQGDERKFKELYKSFGIYYKGFPTLLLAFADLMDKETAKKGSILENVTIDYGREAISKVLTTYNANFFNTKSEAYKKVNALRTPPAVKSTTALARALQYMAKHFLLNYGVFLASLTYSLGFDTMINYIGSSVTKRFFSNNATISYLKNNMKSLGGSMSVHEVFMNVLPFLRYNYQEFAAPIVTTDTSTGLPTINKVVFYPRAELFAPLACNTFFDDNITSASFSRDLNKEPTRLIRLSNPAMLQEKDGAPIMQLSLATVAPFDIVIGTKLKELANKAKTAMASKVANAVIGGGIDETITKEQIEAWCKAAETAYLELFNADGTIKARSSTDRPVSEAEYNTVRDAKENADLLNTQGADKVAAFAKDKKNAAIFDMTVEEKLRGVVPDVYTDNTGVEFAYLLDVINTKRAVAKKEPYTSWSDVQQDPTKDYGDLATDALTKLTTQAKSDETFTLNSYYAAIADFVYREHRRRMRTLNLQTDYSPYRVCGFAGLVYVRDIGAMVGVINSITTRISVNGEAQQQVNFSHVSMLDINKTLADKPDFNDHYTDKLPDYMSEFTIDKVGKNLYNYVTGRDKSSLCDYFATLSRTSEYNLGSNPGTIDHAFVVESEYNKIKEPAVLEQFIYKLTWRNLATMPQLMAVLRNPKNGFKPRKAINAVSSSKTPSAFVLERQQVIEDIFTPIYGKPVFWKDKEGILTYE